MSTIGQRLKTVRLLKGLTGKQLEEISGIGQSTISKIELNQSSPTLATLDQLCQALGISLSDLFTHEDIPNDLYEILLAAKKLSPQQRQALAHFLYSLQNSQNK